MIDITQDVLLCLDLIEVMASNAALFDYMNDTGTTRAILVLKDQDGTSSWKVMKSTRHMSYFFDERLFLAGALAAEAVASSA